MTSTSGMRWLGPAVVVVLMAVAGWVLWQQLAGLDAQAVVRAFLAMPAWRYGLGAALLAGSYIGYGALERLATCHQGHPLPLRRALILAVTAQGLSLTTGKGFLVAGAVRVRLLGRWGYRLSEALVATGIVTLHGNAGMAALIGVLCLLVHPWPWAPWLGLAMAAGVAGWLLACWRLAPLTWGTITVAMPGVPAALRGLVAGGGEKLACILLAAALQPAGTSLPLPNFLAVVVVAIAVARLSQVPGGIGVLEASILGLWPDSLSDADKTDLVAGLLAFRVAYYLLPLGMALPLLAFFGWRRTVPA